MVVVPSLDVESRRWSLRRLPEIVAASALLVVLYEIVCLRRLLGTYFFRAGWYRDPGPLLGFFPGTLFLATVLAAGVATTALRLRLPTAATTPRVLAVAFALLAGTALGEAVRLIGLMRLDSASATWWSPPFDRLGGTLPIFGRRLAVGTGVFTGALLGLAVATPFAGAPPPERPSGVRLRWASALLLLFVVAAHATVLRARFSSGPGGLWNPSTFLTGPMPFLASLRTGETRIAVLIALGAGGLALGGPPRPTRARRPERRERRPSGAVLRTPVDRLRWFLLGGAAVVCAASAGLFSIAAGVLGPIAAPLGPLRPWFHGYLLSLVVLLLWGQTMAGGPAPGRLPRRFAPAAAGITILAGAAFLLSTTFASASGWLAEYRYGGLSSTDVARFVDPLLTGVLALSCALVTAAALHGFDRLGDRREESR